jgi:hypothetical protein
MKYTVILKNKPEEVDNKIAEMVSDGWKPLEDVSVIRAAEPGDSQIICQVMAKDS